MSDYPPQSEKTEISVCESVERGLLELKNLVAQKRSQLNRTVYIVVMGLPDSGKSYFCKGYVNRNYDSAKKTAKAITINDSDIAEASNPSPGSTDISSYLKNADCLLIQAVDGKFGVEAELEKHFGHKPDICVYIYNPKFQSVKYTNSQINDFKPNIVVKNLGSKSKKLPK